MGVRRIFPGGQRRHFTYPSQVVDEAMQMDGHKTVCPPNATMKRPHVTAAVTKMRSLAAITRHESGKDFSWGGGKQSRINRPPFPPIGGTLSQGTENQYRRHGGFFVGLPPKQSSNTPKLNTRN